MSPNHGTNRDSESGSDSEGEVSEQRRSKTPESDAESTGKQSEGRRSKTPESEPHSPGNSEPRRSKTPESEAESTGKRRSKSPESDAESGKRSDNEAREQSDRERSEPESGSEGEQVEATKKRKRAVLSDESGSEADVARKKVMASDDEKEDGDDSVDKDLVIDAEALFGNASDISSEDEGGKKGEKTPKEPEEKEEVEEEHDEEDDEEKAKDGDRTNDLEEGDRDEDKENEGEDQQMETRIDVEVPKITMNLGKELHFIKLPNFLSVETRPFDQANYEDEIDEEETLDEEGRARLKLKVENTIRWREVTGKNGELEKQSNARFVRWSDGSMSLHLGSEIFDVYKKVTTWRSQSPVHPTGNRSSRSGGVQDETNVQAALNRVVHAQKNDDVPGGQVAEDDWH
ncbi:UNVERIFIED_CONTAM: hypothetical protein PYX00_007376 [Menopon gallinae]|uniref:RNA polymerase-associated protein LEO1 n=1 Tax=Menopon gallinae TaxID=328185 RepID=A0AAW2HJQ0_9NEOP